MWQRNRELIVITLAAVCGLLFGFFLHSLELVVFFAAVLAGIAVIVGVTWIITGAPIEDEQDR